jgi:hypothetical protein
MRISLDRKEQLRKRRRTDHVIFRSAVRFRSGIVVVCDAVSATNLSILRTVSHGDGGIVSALLKTHIWRLTIFVVISGAVGTKFVRWTE